MTTKSEAVVALVSEFTTFDDVVQYVEDLRAHGIPGTAAVEGYAVARFASVPTPIMHDGVPSVMVVLNQEEDGDDLVPVE